MRGLPDNSLHPNGAAVTVRSRFGACLRAGRQERRLSQADVARRVGVTRQYISAIERGRVNITIDAMTALASAYEADMTVSIRMEPPSGANEAARRPEGRLSIDPAP